jgi:hypothetical protein
MNNCIQMFTCRKWKQLRETVTSLSLSAINYNSSTGGAKISLQLNTVPVLLCATSILFKTDEPQAHRLGSQHPSLISSQTQKKKSLAWLQLNPFCVILASPSIQQITHYTRCNWNLRTRVTHTKTRKIVHVNMCLDTFNLWVIVEEYIYNKCKNVLHEIQCTPRHVSSWTVASVQRCLGSCG